MRVTQVSGVAPSSLDSGQDLGKRRERLVGVDAGGTQDDSGTGQRAERHDREDAAGVDGLVAVRNLHSG